MGTLYILLNKGPGGGTGRHAGLKQFFHCHFVERFRKNCFFYLEEKGCSESNF